VCKISVEATVTKIDRYTVNTRGIEHHEVGRAAAGQWAMTSTMAKLISDSELLQGDLVKKLTIPFLQPVSHELQ
jgi:hypothetical protein